MINKKRWSKKHTKIATSIAVVLIIIIIAILYFLSPNAKLKRLGYSKYDIDLINENVSEKNIKEIINHEYVAVVANFINDDNYAEKNIIRYIDYYIKNNKVKLKDIVHIVNGNADNYDYSDFLLDCVVDENYVYLNVDRYINYHNEYENAPARETIILVNSEIEKPYTDKLGAIINEGYFIVNNTERYINYADSHPKTSSANVVAIVNSSTDRNQYTVNNNVDFSKGNNILVNKYYKLSSSYNNPVAKDVPSEISDGNIKLEAQTLSAIEELIDNARDNGYNIVVKRGYLNYTELSNLYYSYSRNNGEWYADSYLGKAGYSEYQTGFAVALAVRGDSIENFGTTAAFRWVQANAHKYGFILRYPKGKEYLTGYAYMPFHFRYVGKETANQIKESGLTFDEYYAYYIENH